MENSKEKKNFIIVVIISIIAVTISIIVCVKNVNTRKGTEEAYDSLLNDYISLEHNNVEASSKAYDEWLNSLDKDKSKIYSEAYSQGYENGSDDSWKEAYREGFNDGLDKANDN